MRSEVTNLHELLTPIWQGNTVYNESVMVIENGDGTIDPIELAYPIDSILFVRSSSLQTIYTEHVDYKVENGKLIILSNKRIPVMEYNEYYPLTSAAGQTFERSGGGHIRFSEGSYFHERQIVVTYRHGSTWKGTVPRAQSDRIPFTTTKLKNKEALHIVYYGDSITVGANSSAFVHAAPHIPIWADIVTAALKSEYGYTDITSVNTSVGGMTSDWGINNIQENVIDKNPDLVFIGFGMNDRISLSKYKQNILDMIVAVRASNPDCEFILVGTMLPNAEAKGFFVEHDKMVGVLEEIAREGTGIAVADVTSVHSHLLNTKKYADMTGNNVNHPNDFLGRIYAQVVMSVFGISEKES